MYPILYDETQETYGSIPQHNGLGVLSDALSCSVTEVRNGSYELELTYPASGIHASEIQLRHLIKAKPNFTDDPQLFRIYKIGKVLGNNFKVNARHISYDLSGSEITTGTAGSAISACALLSTNEFTVSTDKNLAANFKITEPSSRRSWFGGKAGSILDVYGPGEWKYDNYTAQFLLHRGIDRGVEVRYGKNLLSLSQDRDASPLTTGVILFWKNMEDDTVVYSAKQSTGLTLDCEQVQCIDVSNDFEEQPTVAQLNLKAQAYVQAHNFSVVKNSIKLNFLQIATLKDRVDLCDTVKIYYEDFGINAEAKCIKTVWDVLDEKYTSIELGDTKANFADTFIATTAETRSIINQNQTMLERAIQNATSLITGNEGGYVILHDSNDDNYPDEILIMNTADIATATKVWRWNQAGLGYSNTGYAGTYGLAMTMDGSIVASFITTGTMSANRVRTGRIESVNGNTWIDLDANSAHFETLNLDIGGTSMNAATAISNAQSTADGKVSPSAVRTAFAADATSIVIQSGTIKFKSNTFLVESSNLNIDATGNIKSSSFKSNASIEFYSTDWNTQYLQIGTDVVSSSYIKPYLRMKASSGNDSIYIGAAPSSGSGYQSVVQLEDPSASNQAVHMLTEIANRLYNKNGYETISFEDQGRVVIQPGGSVVTYYDGWVRISSQTGTVNIEMTGQDGKITCTSVTQTSARRYKTNIKSMTEDEAIKILELNPVNFDFVDDRGKDKVGFIAEEVESVLPKLIEYKNDEVEGLNYVELIPYLTKLIQIQQKQIDELKEKIS